MYTKTLDVNIYCTNTYIVVHYIVLHTYIVHYIINIYIYCVDVYILTLKFSDTQYATLTNPSHSSITVTQNFPTREAINIVPKANGSLGG